MAKNIDSFVSEELVQIVNKYMTTYYQAQAYAEQGWKQIHLDLFQKKKLSEMQRWCAKYCIHPYFCDDSRFLFENQTDASWFSLRWL